MCSRAYLVPLPTYGPCRDSCEVNPYDCGGCSQFEQRASAEQLLSHPFLQSASSREEFGHFVQVQLAARKRK
jgi:hypothetical protein